MGLRQEGGKTLITPSGGSGGDTTIDAPLGSQPAANSVSVALASDQIPLPVLASIDTTGLATDSNQITEIARLTSILAQLDVALSTRASEATLATLLTTSSFESRINSLGQKASTFSTPVVIASDQSVIPISGSVTVSGTVDVTEPVTVDAVNLDIRDLVFATDKVDVSGSTGVGVTGPLTDIELRATPVPISGSVSISGNVTVNQPVTVQATELDIRDLTFATDKVDASSSVITAKDDKTNVVSINWGVGTPSGTTQELDVSNYASMAFQISYPATLGGNVFIFIEGTIDGSTWIGIAILQSPGGTSFGDQVSVGVIFIGNSAYGPRFSYTNVAGLTKFRFRTSGTFTGSGSFICNMAASSAISYSPALTIVRGEVLTNVTTGTTVPSLPVLPVIANAVAPTYVENKAAFLSTDLAAGLRVKNLDVAASLLLSALTGILALSGATVNDTSENLLPGTVNIPSMTTDGRIRVSAEEDQLEFFKGNGPFFDIPDLTSPDNLLIDAGGINPRSWLE